MIVDDAADHLDAGAVKRLQMIDVQLPTTDCLELVLTRYTEFEPELSNRDWNSPRR